MHSLSHADYEGVSLMSRDASQKSAAAEATAIFQNYYPEFLASLFRHVLNMTTSNILAV